MRSPGRRPRHPISLSRRVAARHPVRLAVIVGVASTLVASSLTVPAQAAEPVRRDWPGISQSESVPGVDAAVRARPADPAADAALGDVGLIDAWSLQFGAE